MCDNISGLKPLLVSLSLRTNVYQITFYCSKSVLTERRSDVCEIQFKIHVIMIVACEQALWGILTAGRKKEGELRTTSLEFEYLHRKSLCEMLIVGDDISNNVITLNWLVFFNESLFTFALISASRWLVEISQLSQWGATGDLGLNSSCKLSFLFLPCCQCTWRACSQTIVIVSRETTSKFEGNLSKLENYNTLWVYYNKLYLMNNLTIFLLQPWNRKNSLGSPRHDQFIGRNRY